MFGFLSLSLSFSLCEFNPIPFESSRAFVFPSFARQFIGLRPRVSEATLDLRLVCSLKGRRRVEEEERKKRKAVGRRDLGEGGGGMIWAGLGLARQSELGVGLWVEWRFVRGLELK